MNISTDPTVADTLRSVTASTVRGILQTAGVQALSSEIRQQTPAARSQPSATNTSNNHNAAPGQSTSATVELSPAAKFPPLASLTAPAAAQTRPSDLVLSATLRLPTTLAMSTQAVGPEHHVREVLQLAIKIGQLTGSTTTTQASTAPTQNLMSSASMTPQGVVAAYSAPFAASQYAAMKPWRDSMKPAANTTTSVAAPARALWLESAHSVPNTARADAESSLAPMPTLEPRIDNVRPEHMRGDSLRADAARVEALYGQNGAAGYARVDISRLADGQAPEQAPGTFAVTLQVRLPTLGDIVITLALNQTRSDLAFAATPSTLDVLESTQNEFRTAAHAWGLNLKGLSFIPFISQGAER